MKKTMKAIDPQGFRTTARNAGEDDVEGHRHNVGRAVEPEGFRTTARNAGEDDVEGHRHNVGRALDPEGLTLRNADDDDDTEGHSMANALIGREISRAREIEIQRNLKAHAARDEATRPHKK